MSGGWRRALAEGWRQRGQHAAFRIGPARWDTDQRRRLADLAAKLSTTDNGGGAELDEHALAEAGNGLWKARGRLGAAAGQDRRARQAVRHLDRTEQALAGVGLVIKDHTGDFYHSGHALEVIAMVDDAALTEQTVVETVRPSIYLADRLIQLGQVVVAFPPRQQDRPNQHSPAEPGATEEDPRA